SSARHTGAGSRGGARGSSRVCARRSSRAHRLPQALRPEIRPDLLDVGEAFRLRPAFSGLLPPARQRAVDGPDRVLLLLVPHDVVAAAVVILEHGLAPSFLWT